MSSKRVINSMIARWGEIVTIMPRDEVVDEEGYATYTFPEHRAFTTRALIYDASGLREEWYVIGVGDQVDYVASFSEKLRNRIKVHDRVELNDGTLTIVNTIIDRGRGPDKDFLEILLKRGV